MDVKIGELYNSTGDSSFPSSPPPQVRVQSAGLCWAIEAKWGVASVDTHIISGDGISAPAHVCSESKKIKM